VTERQAHLRARAASDIDETITYLRGEAGDAVSLAFIDALENGISHITRSPNAGSLRFAYELGIPELRAWGVRGFPYVIFYMLLGDRIDIWRVLHTRRDIQAHSPGTTEPRE
jgi:toxin ParE1/3/4